MSSRPSSMKKRGSNGVVAKKESTPEGSVLSDALFKVLLLVVPPIIVLIILLSISAPQKVFVIAGGSIGLCCSLYVLWQSWNAPAGVGSYKILFWGAFCDVGLAARFLSEPLIEYFTCGHVGCKRTAVLGKCAFPSFWFEFFAIASEFWFLCNGLDLYASITNPFSSVESRLFTYHTLTWGASLLMSIGPLFAGDEIYGLWFVNPRANGQPFCWITTTTNNERGVNNWTFPIWVFFFVPLLIIYVICIACLVIAYRRLQKGVTRTFLPRMKLLATNTISVVCLILYWVILFILYFATWVVDNPPLAQALYHALIYVVATKGFSAFFAWMFLQGTMDSGGLESVDLVDANKSLREEVLNFATAGIRSSARAGINATPLRREVSRRPQRAATEGKGQLSLLNFARFVLGSPNAIREVNLMIGGNRRSVLPNFGRQTNVFIDERDSDFDSTVLNHLHGENRLTENAVDLETASARLSQRPTIVMGAGEVTGGGHFRVNDAPVNRDSMLEMNTLANQSTRERPTGAAHKSSMFSSQSTKSSATINSRDVEISDDAVQRRYVSEMSTRPSEMVETNLSPGNGEIESDCAEEYTNEKLTLYQRFRRRIAAPFDDSNNDVEFTEFEPYQFRRIRYSVGITDEIYINCFSTTIKERLTQGGASGAFFFFSKGEQFIAKSCTAAEIETIKSSAGKYADYLETNKDTFITKIFGAYKLRIYSNSLYFFVMNNLFLNPEKLSMNEKYDLKGSWVSRNAEPPLEGQSVTCSHCEQKFIYKKKRRGKKQSAFKRSNTGATDSTADSERSPLSLTPAGVVALSARGDSMDKFGNSSFEGVGEEACPYTVDGQHEPNLILKDNDLKYKIRLPTATAVAIYNQIGKDCDYLMSCGIMDYSLLVGVHNTEYEVLTDGGSSGGNLAVIRSGTKIPEIAASGAGFVPLSTVSQNNSMTPHASEEIENNVRESVLGNGRQSGESMSSGTSFSTSMSGMRPSGRMGGGIEDASAATARKLEVFRIIGPDAYFMGIIDFQQKWTVKKKLERFYKTTFRGADPMGLSAIEPVLYRDRFLKKIEDILDFDDYAHTRQMSTSAVSRNNSPDDSAV